MARSWFNGTRVEQKVIDLRRLGSENQQLDQELESASREPLKRYESLTQMKEAHNGANRRRHKRFVTVQSHH